MGGGRGEGTTGDRAGVALPRAAPSTAMETALPTRLSPAPAACGLQLAALLPPPSSLLPPPSGPPSSRPSQPLRSAPYVPPSPSLPGSCRRSPGSGRRRALRGGGERGAGDRTVGTWRGRGEEGARREGARRTAGNRLHWRTGSCPAPTPPGFQHELKLDEAAGVARGVGHVCHRVSLCVSVRAVPGGNPTRACVGGCRVRGAGEDAGAACGMRGTQAERKHPTNTHRFPLLEHRFTLAWATHTILPHTSQVFTSRAHTTPAVSPLQCITHPHTQGPPGWGGG